MKKLLRIIITLILTISILPISAMAETTFKDVSPDDWFYDNVNTAVEYGLMNGVSETEFAPDDKVTFGMAITLASRIHSIYMKDGEKFEYTEGGWAKPYVDYAFKVGIIGENGYEDLTQLELFDEVGNQIAGRLDIANIFSKSLPKEALKEINTVEYGAIPDMMYDIIGIEDDEYINTGVYTLYRAGVFAGSDEKGSFNPYEPITRAEIAAIASRMLKNNLRQKVNLKSDTYDRLMDKQVNGYASEEELISDFLDCIEKKEVSQRFMDAFDHTYFAAEILNGDLSEEVSWDKVYDAVLNFDKGVEYIKKNHPEIVKLYEKKKELSFSDETLSYYLFGVFLPSNDAKYLNLSEKDLHTMDIRETMKATLNVMCEKYELQNAKFNPENIYQYPSQPERYSYGESAIDLEGGPWQIGIEYIVQDGEYRWFLPTRYGLAYGG